MNEECFTKKIANKLMTEMARGVSESLSIFATWLLAGFSAAFGIILANLKDISRFIQIEAIKAAIFLFLLSLVIAVIQRWLSSIIQTGLKSSDAGERLDTIISQSEDIINQEILLQEIEKASYYPMKFYIKKQYQKLRDGDLTAIGRQQLKLAQIQGFLMVSQVLIAVCSLIVFVNGIKM